MSSPAPVILFIYNRPTHARNTLEALKANELSNRSELFIFADGPKASATADDRKRIEETRAIAREQQWCGTVTITERTSNIGLAANIIDGVTSIVNKYGKVIVIEDDVITSPSFLTYMNNALEAYKTDPKVMHVAGYSFPWLESSEVKDETFFYRVPTCWGWATWDRAWKYYEDDSRRLFVRLCEKNLMSAFDFGYSGGFLGQLNANLTNAVRTWAVKWYASVLLQGGLALHPSTSLVNNIGFDSSGMNSAATNIFDHKSLGHLGSVELREVKENKYVAQKMFSAYKNTIPRRIKSFLANRIKNFILLKYFKKDIG